MQAWHVMGRTLDWQALPFLVELYGVPDVEVFISELVAIREYVTEKQNELARRPRTF